MGPEILAACQGNESSLKPMIPARQSRPLVLK
jgi:hypothetical protein